MNRPVLHKSGSEPVADADKNVNASLLEFYARLQKKRDQRKAHEARDSKFFLDSDDDQQYRSSNYNHNYDYNRNDEDNSGNATFATTSSLRHQRGAGQDTSSSESPSSGGHRNKETVDSDKNTDDGDYYTEDDEAGQSGTKQNNTMSTSGEDEAANNSEQNTNKFRDKVRKLRAMSSTSEDEDLPGSRPSQVLRWISTVEQLQAKRGAVPLPAPHVHHANNSKGKKSGSGGNQGAQRKGSFMPLPKSSASSGGSSGNKSEASGKPAQRHSFVASSASPAAPSSSRASQRPKLRKQLNPMGSSNSSSKLLSSDGKMHDSKSDMGDESKADQSTENAAAQEKRNREKATEELNNPDDLLETVPAAPVEEPEDQRRREEHHVEPQDQIIRSYSTTYARNYPEFQSDIDILAEAAPKHSKSDAISPGMSEESPSETWLEGTLHPPTDYDSDDLELGSRADTYSKITETSEQRQQFTKNVRERFDGVAGHVIFPNSRWILYWDLIILFLIMFCAVYVPFQIGITDGQLVYQAGYAFLVFTFINIIFIFDTAINFYRVYFDNRGRPVINGNRIKMHYLKGWFVIDLLACLPVDIIYRFINTNIGGGINVMAFVNMLRVFRLLRAYRIVQTNARLLRMRLRSQQPLLQLAFVMGVFLMFAHWGGCMYSFVALVEAGSFKEKDLMDPDKQNWLQANSDSGVYVVGNSMHAAMGRYTLSLYWAITTITSVGYGDITPTTMAEHWYTTCFMLLAGLMWAYFLGVVISVLEELQENKKAFHSRIADVNRLAKYFQNVYEDETQLPFEDPTLAADARSFLHKQYIASGGRSDGTKLTDLAPVLDQMPPRLRNRICLALVRKDLLSVPYFRHFAIDLHTIGGVAALCEIHQFDTGEIMYIERATNSSKRGVYIVREGVLAFCEANSIRTRSMRILAGGGTVMEDYVLFPHDSPEIPPIVTIAFWTFTEVLFVPRKAIRAMFRLHPDVWESMGRWRIMYVRLQRWARSILGMQKEEQDQNVQRIMNTFSSDEFNKHAEDNSRIILALARPDTNPQEEETDDASSSTQQTSHASQPSKP